MILNIYVTRVPKRKTIYSYDKTDYEKMKTMLSIDWKTALADMSTQEAMDKLEETTKEAADQCVPHYTVTDNGRDKPIWMTKSALRTVRRKHSVWIRYLNTKEGEAYQTYIRSRNTAQHAIRRARRQFETKLVKECRTNNKGIWNYIRNRTNTRGRSTLQRGWYTYPRRQGSSRGPQPTLLQNIHKRRHYKHPARHTKEPNY